MEWKDTDSSGKEKVLRTGVNKEVMLTGFFFGGGDMEGPITVDFLEKGATVNNAPYCQLHYAIFHFTY